MSSLLPKPKTLMINQARASLSFKTSSYRLGRPTNNLPRSYSSRQRPSDVPHITQRDATASSLHTSIPSENNDKASLLKSVPDKLRRKSTNGVEDDIGRQSQIRPEKTTSMRNTESNPSLEPNIDFPSKSLPSSLGSDSSCAEPSWLDTSSFDPPPWEIEHGIDESLSESDTVVFQSSNDALPLSPLLDQGFYEARDKYRQSKKKPPQNLTPMQIAIRKNPYAFALSTPVRKCRLTGVALPRFFLLDFSAIQDPKTGVSWYMPRGLTNHRLLNPIAVEKCLPGQYRLSISNPVPDNQVSEHESISTTESSRLLSDEIKMAENPGQTEGFPLPPGLNLSYSSAPKIGGGTYILRSYSAIQTLQNMNSKASSALFLTQTMRNNPLALETHRKTRIRPDMAEFVLTLQRRRVMEWLILVTSRAKGYLSKFIPTKSLKTHQVAAVILLGPPVAQPTDNTATEKDFFAFIQENPSYVPVFDLRILLGEEMLQQLKNTDLKRWKSEVLVLKKRNYAMPILTSLWELEGYHRSILYSA